MSLKLFVLIVAAGLALMLPMRAESKPLTTEAKIDLQKYSGKWFEIARLPNFFERNCEKDITAEYTVGARGDVTVRNSCATKQGKVIVANGVAKKATEAQVTLKVTFVPAALRFLPFVWANYTVIKVDEDYRYALVGEPGRKYLWVLCREKSLADETYQSLLKLAQEEGFDTSKMIKN